MFDLLNRSLPAVGRVLFSGTIPPPADSMSWPAGLEVAALPPTDQFLWRVEVEHPQWGKAEIVAFRHGVPLDPLLLQVSQSLSASEKADAARGQGTLGVRVTTSRGSVLRDRKHLLRWLLLLSTAGGLVAIDDMSWLPWSRAMLEDELLHDADLDVEALYTLQAVTPDGGGAVSWLHTHGLEEVGAFDIDILEPSEMLIANISDPMRSLACAALEGSASPRDGRYAMAHPGGDVRLVPVSDFNRMASAEHRALRDELPAHSGRRVVLCEPVGGLFARWRQTPVPSRFLSRVDADRLVFPFSDSATVLTAERARLTVPVLRRISAEFAEFEFPALAKFGYETENGGREHLWFQCHAIHDDHVEATLLNAPFDVPALKEGDRGSHPFDRLSDWQILSPAGPMTPRNISAARRVREQTDELRSRLRQS